MYIMIGMLYHLMKHSKSSKVMFNLFDVSKSFDIMRNFIGSIMAIQRILILNFTISRTYANTFWVGL